MERASALEDIDKDIAKTSKKVARILAISTPVEVLPADDGLRPAFLGHIVTEMLLDAVLIGAQPRRLHDYYAALERVDWLYEGPMAQSGNIDHSKVHDKVVGIDYQERTVTLAESGAEPDDIAGFLFRIEAAAQAGPRPPPPRLADYLLDLNPAETDTLVNLTLGGYFSRGRIWVLHSRFRYFDPVARRAGLPPDVGALVEKLGADSATLTLVNLSPVVARTVVGKDAQIKILREGKEQTLSVRVAERPSDEVLAKKETTPPKEPADTIKPPDNVLASLKVQALDNATMSQLNIPSRTAGVE